MHGLQGPRRSSGLGRHLRFYHRITARRRGVKQRELAREVQGQIKVTHWVASTLTAISDLLEVGLGDLHRKGELCPYPGTFIPGVRSSRCDTDLVCSACGFGPGWRHKVLLGMGYILAWNHILLSSREGEREGVLNNPGELIFCNILLNQVEEIQRSPEKTARLLLGFLLAGSWLVGWQRANGFYGYEWCMTVKWSVTRSTNWHACWFNGHPGLCLHRDA